MATLVAPEDVRPQTAPADDMAWLDGTHRIFLEHQEGWRREERRYYGGDAVINKELLQFDGETSTTFTARKGWSDFPHFPRDHVRAITGELSRKRPIIGKGLNLGGLGELRPRSKITGRPTFAELFYYNVDGVGQDGSEFTAWMDGVDERSQVTGHRWLMVESPEGAGAVLPLRDVLAGARPFAVEYSPLDVPMWSIVRGQLQFAVIRVETEEPRIEDGKFSDGSEKGYYLHVRKGCRALGSAYQGGGWWLFDHEKRLIRNQPWKWAEGDIPMWIHYGQRDRGTPDHPALSKSSTMELGQIAVALMNVRSAYIANYWDACSPLTLLLGAGPTEMKALAEQIEARGIYAGVPFPTDSTGAAQGLSVHEASASAVPAAISDQVISSLYAAAREQSFQQITSTPESSGESKKAGHAENKAPILAMRARERQQSENTLIHYFEKRFGVVTPSGSSEWPTDFNLEPLTDAIDAAFDTLRKSKLRSKTAEVGMVLTSLSERGVVNDENRGTVQTELDQSYDDQAATEQATRELLSGGGGGNGNGTFPAES